MAEGGPTPEVPGDPVTASPGSSMAEGGPTQETVAPRPSATAAALPRRRSLWSSVWAGLLRLDGFALLLSIVLAMAISLRSGHVGAVEDQVQASRAVANEAFQTFVDLTALAQSGQLDAATIEARMRNLRYLHYSTDRQIPAGRHCLNVLITKIDYFFAAVETKGLRLDFPTETTERGEILSTLEKMPGDMENLKERLEIWETENMSYLRPVLAWFGIVDSDRTFRSGCLARPA